ncbi:MAG: precorrin-3B synthase, partial [Thiohalospira sp.]
MSYTIRNACPGVAAPMATGDGLLLRLRQPLDGLSAEQARAIAATAEACGSGRLELTMRAGLQLRGITAGTQTEARERLVAAGVADADPDEGAVRNVVAAPLADLDPAATAPVAATARAIAQALVADPGLRGLPPKVGVVVDGGGRAHIGGVAGDIRVEALADGAFHLALGGTAEAATPLGRCPAGAVPEAVTALLRRFLA